MCLLFRAHCSNLNEDIDPYCQVHKCSAQTLVYKGYADIRGGSLDRGYQIRVVSSKIAIFFISFQE